MRTTESTLDGVVNGNASNARAALHETHPDPSRQPETVSEMLVRPCGVPAERRDTTLFEAVCCARRTLSGSKNAPASAPMHPRRFQTSCGELSGDARGFQTSCGELSGDARGFQTGCGELSGDARGFQTSCGQLSDEPRGFEKSFCKPFGDSLTSGKSFRKRLDHSLTSGKSFRKRLDHSLASGKSFRKRLDHSLGARDTFYAGMVNEQSGASSSSGSSLARVAFQYFGASSR